MSRTLRCLVVALFALTMSLVLVGPLHPEHASARAKRQVTLTGSPASAVTGSRVTLRGKAPKSPTGTRITIQRLTKGKWKSIGKARTTRKARFTYVLRAGAPGTYKFRAAAPANAKKRLPAGISRPVAVKVKAKSPWRTLPNGNRVAKVAGQYGKVPNVSRMFPKDGLWYPGEPACFPDKTCVSLGKWSTCCTNFHPVGITYKGGSWTLTEIRIPTGFSSIDTGFYMGDFRCASSTTCVGVGEATSAPLGTRHPATLRFSAGTWTIDPGPRLAGQEVEGFLRTLACPSANSCVAAGRAYTDDAGQRVLAGAWAGDRWVLASLALPTGSYNVFPQQSACPSADWCLGAVNYANDAGVTPTVLRFDGATWALDTLPLPSGAQRSLDFDAEPPVCTAVGSCVLAGSYLGTDQQVHSVSYTLAGGAWTAERT